MKYVLLLIGLLATNKCFSKDLLSGSALYFIENKGQLTDQNNKQRNDIDLVLSNGNINVFIGNGALHYQWRVEKNTEPASKNDWPTSLRAIPGADRKQLKTYRMDVELLGANINASPVLEDIQPYYERYYYPRFGEQGMVANSYRKATYKNIYPGIDWVVYIKNDMLEYDFVVNENGNPADIKIKYRGAGELHVNAAGSFTATTPMGSITEAKPLSYQADGSPVASSFSLNEGVLSFGLAPYSGKLVIDPVINWSTYFLGGQNDTWPWDITTYGTEHIYICGSSLSTGLATTGAHQGTVAGGTDGYVTKFDSAGNRIWTTYYGGPGTDECIGLVCDMVGDLYVTGFTNSATGIATAGTHQPQYAAGFDAFLVKFDSSGACLWGTYYGGEGSEIISRICIAGDNEPYLSGRSTSDTGIATQGTHQVARAGGADMFLAKFSQSGARLWGTYFGGPDLDINFSCYHDQIDGIYLLGYTNSATGIATAGSHQPAIYSTNYNDACLARFNDAGQLIWATYYGGEGEDRSDGLACDNAGNVYFTGNTGLGHLSYPASLLNISTPGSYQPSASNSTSEEIFLVKFDSTGQRIWGTYFGGQGYDRSQINLAMDQWNNIFFTGTTSSSAGIATNGAWQPTLNSSFDAFVTKFDSSGALLWSSYFGGEGDYEEGVSCAFDGYQNLYICGTTNSTTGIATVGAFQTVNPAGYNSTYISRINDCIVPAAPAALTGNTIVCAGDTLIYSVPGVNGAVSYTWVLPGGWSGSSNTNTINVVTGSTGGNITVTAHSSCATGVPLVVAVTVANPMPVITAVGNVLSTGTFSSYQWYLNGNIIPGATSQSYTVTQGGAYTVVVTDNNGCTGTSPQYLDVVNTIMANKVAIYPNPADDVIIVEGSNVAEIVIINIQGQVVKQRHSKGRTTELNIASLQPGVYFVTVTAGDGARVTKKVVKE